MLTRSKSAKEAKVGKTAEKLSTKEAKVGKTAEKTSAKEAKVAKMSSNIIMNIETFDDPSRWMGYKIIMSDKKKNITCKIENSQYCCENWGIHTISNLNEFIGAEYYSIDVVEKGKTDENENMMILDVIITTNRGNITLCFYNEHNGYYPHDVFIQSEDDTQRFKL
jgi:hypothetical protein